IDSISSCYASVVLVLLRLRFCSPTRSLSCLGNTSWGRPSNHCPVKTVVGLLVATSGITLVGAQMIKLLLTLFSESPRRVLPGTRASAIWPFSESELLAYPFLGDSDA